MSGLSSVTGCGISLICAASNLCGELSTNGGRPVNISYAMQPNE